MITQMDIQQKSTYNTKKNKHLMIDVYTQVHHVSVKGSVSQSISVVVKEKQEKKTTKKNLWIQTPVQYFSGLFFFFSFCYSYARHTTKVHKCLVQKHYRVREDE